MHPSTSRSGVAMGATAYLIWGSLPVYLHALAPASAPEVLAHRIVWSSLTCAVLVLILRSWGELRAVVRDRGVVARLTIAALLVATNWLIYTWAVLADHVVEAALGYYINPLITVLLGVVLLRERLRPAQWFAIAVAAAAVAVLTGAFGRPPWIAILLAVSFALYGLMKKRVAGRVSALGSMTVETTLLFAPAAAFLIVLQAIGQGTFTSQGVPHALMLAGSGVVTAVPLLLFAGAAGRIPLSLLGLLQYLTPTGQFLLGVLVLGEAMTTSRWIGFALVWTALVILSTDTIVATRKRRG